MTSGMRSITGMPNITLSASRPPTPQPSTPMPLIIGVWLSVPISVSGTAQVTPSRVSVVTTRRQPLEVDRVHDAGAGRMHAEAVEGARRPFHEAVALGVAPELPLHVALEGVAASRNVDGERMVDRDVDRQDGIEPARVAAGLGERRAHAGDVDQGRDAGGVVHQDAAGQERDLRLAASRASQSRIAALARRRVLARIAQHVLQHDAQDVRQPLEVGASRRRQIDHAVTFASTRDFGGLW